MLQRSCAAGTGAQKLKSQGQNSCSLPRATVSTRQFLKMSLREEPPPPSHELYLKTAQVTAKIHSTSIFYLFIYYYFFKDQVDADVNTHSQIWSTKLHFFSIQW